MAFTQAQLSELESAYASGKLSVKWRDADGNTREAQFDSREGLKARIDEIRAALGVTKRPLLNLRRTSYSRGTT